MTALILPSVFLSLLMTQLKFMLSMVPRIISIFHLDIHRQHLKRSVFYSLLGCRHRIQAIRTSQVEPAAGCGMIQLASLMCPWLPDPGYSSPELASSRLVDPGVPRCQAGGALLIIPHRLQGHTARSSLTKICADAGSLQFPADSPDLRVGWRVEFTLLTLTFIFSPLRSVMKGIQFSALVADIRESLENEKTEAESRPWMSTPRSSLAGTSTEWDRKPPQQDSAPRLRPPKQSVPSTFEASFTQSVSSQATLGQQFLDEVWREWESGRVDGRVKVEDTELDFRAYKQDNYGPHNDIVSLRPGPPKNKNKNKKRKTCLYKN
ncbi:hypothetical protein BU17DRAFT_72482 [Hysterangium stoloniferum]|nr:hypothetical protein BU17DRAFT_72482 [Hysterangium stoloniferum]